MRYDGYRSFSYLRPGEDYPDIRLAAEVDRVPPYDLGLTAEQASRAERLLRDELVVSVHDHPQVFPADMTEAPNYCSRGRTWLGYEGLAQSGLDVVFDNLAGPTGCIASRCGWSWGDVVHDIGMRTCDLAHQDQVVLVRSLDDIADVRATGRIGLVLGIEAATPIENDVDRLDVLYGMGVRQVGVVYNEANLLGGGLAEPRDGGLTRFGHRAVARMNDLGLSVDISHAGDRTSLDVIEASTAPVMISHAGARGVWPTERMKPDHVLRALAGSGGLLGIEAAPHSTVSAGHPRHCIDSVMDHFQYCVDLMGIDHVTFGPDTLYGDHVALHAAFADVFGKGHSTPTGRSDPASRVGVVDVTVETVDYCAGMENPTECFRNVIRWLVEHGYGDDDIRKVVGGNAMRVLAQTW